MGWWSRTAWKSRQCSMRMLPVRKPCTRKYPENPPIPTAASIAKLACETVTTSPSPVGPHERDAACREGLRIAYMMAFHCGLALSSKPVNNPMETLQDEALYVRQYRHSGE